jgi:[ribosomal protein S5]-alanine N-acetyltransferase
MLPYHYPDQLESERLITRHLTEADISLWSEFFREEEAIEFFPMYQNKPADESAREWIERQCTRYTKQEYGMQALIEKSTGTLVGQCGLIAKEIDGITELEVGYSILKEYWGLGYAAEAARLFIDFAFQNHLVDSVISTISPGNRKSIRIAEKNGLSFEKISIWQGMELCVYRLHRITWKEQ